MKSTKSLNSLNDQSQRATKQKNTQLDSGQITIIPKPELTAFSGDSLTKSLFGGDPGSSRYDLPSWIM